MIMVVLALRLIITLDQWFFVQMKLMSFDSYLILTYSTKSIKKKKSDELFLIFRIGLQFDTQLSFN